MESFHFRSAAAPSDSLSVPSDNAISDGDDDANCNNYFSVLLTIKESEDSVFSARDTSEALDTCSENSSTSSTGKVENDHHHSSVTAAAPRSSFCASSTLANPSYSAPRRKRHRPRRRRRYNNNNRCRDHDFYHYHSQPQQHQHPLTIFVYAEFFTLLFRFLASRFAPRMPVTTRHDVVKGLFFYIEESFWFVIDTIERLFGKALNLTFVNFVRCWHETSPLPFVQDDDEIHAMCAEFAEYKRVMPICCAVLVSQDNHLLLVKPSVAKKKNWMLPGGKMKIYERENTRECAVREVFEETGLDISHHHLTSHQAKIYGRQVTLFLCCDLDRQGESSIPTPNHKEISDVRWFSLDKILSTRPKGVPRPPEVPKLSTIIQKMLPVIRRILSGDDGCDTGSITTAPTACGTQSSNGSKYAHTLGALLERIDNHNSLSNNTSAVAAASAE